MRSTSRSGALQRPTGTPTRAGWIFSATVHGLVLTGGLLGGAGPRDPVQPEVSAAESPAAGFLPVETAETWEPAAEPPPPPLSPPAEEELREPVAIDAPSDQGAPADVVPEDEHPPHPLGDRRVVFAPVRSTQGLRPRRPSPPVSPPAPAVSLPVDDRRPPAATTPTPASSLPASTALGPVRKPRPLDDTNRAPRAPRRLSGRVVVRLQVNALGTVDAVVVVAREGAPRLESIVVEAVRAWRFDPAVQDGRPIAHPFVTEFVFR